MQPLSTISGKSFVGYGVLFLVFLFSCFGVDIKADAPALVAAIGNFIAATSALIQAISTLVGLGLALWGHLELARKHGALRQIAFAAGIPPQVVNAPVQNRAALSSSATSTPIPPAMTKNLIALLTIGLLTVSLTACSSYSANLTTTAGSKAATVDNAGPIAAGADITSADTATNTQVASITGTNLVINPAATATGTVTAAFKNTVAVQFQDDLQSYTQTLVNALYTDTPVILADVGNAAKLTADVGTLLEAWGLTPVNAKQRTTVGNIIEIANQVGSDSASLTTVLSGIQTTGVVPTLTTSATGTTSL